MRVAAVLTGGICYALALPPFDWASFGWLTLLPLLLAIRGESIRSACCYGVLLGYASGWAVTWCFAEAAARYFQLSLPVAVMGVSLWYLVVCGVPFGLFAAASAVVLRSYRFTYAGVLIPALWVATEILRGRVMGQPWALLGYTQHDHPGLIQVAAFSGVYGVSFLVALGSVALAEAAWRLHRREGTRAVLRSFLVPATVISVCWLGGALFARTSQTSGFNEREVAIVQTNVAPSLRWTRAYTDAQVGAHIHTTDAISANVRPALIVWPENSVPRYLEAEPGLAVQLASLAVRHRADLVFGGPRSDGERVFNTARLITASGKNGGYYDKQRLLLFAEEKRFIRTANPSDSPEEFTSGSRSGVLHGFVALGVSICHEIVHGSLIAQSVRDGAELLVNIANDGWLDAGYEFAGRQHLAMAVFRAVESRRYLVRASTTGNSAVIDPYGRVIGTLAPGTTGILAMKVAGRSTLTPYVRLGDLFGFLCVALAGVALLRQPEHVAHRRPFAVHAPAAS